MSLPSDYDRVTVSGRYVYLDGTPVSGTVTFTGKATVSSPAAKTMIVPDIITCTLDENGAFSVPLPATDDPDITGSGWTYKVKENFRSGGGRTFELPVSIDAKDTGIDLSTVAVGIPPSDGTTIYAPLEAVQALQSDVESVSGLAQDAADAASAAQTAADAAQASAALVGDKVAKNTQTYDVHDFGAVGDGVTDDTLAINAAITAAPAGSRVLLRPGHTYLQTGQIVISKPLTLSGYGAALTTSTLNLVQVYISASDVRCEGFELAGPGGGDITYDSQAGGIHVVGPESLLASPDFANTINRISLVDLNIHDLRRCGIYAEYVRDIIVDRCVIERCTFANISFGSVDGGQITGCRIDTCYMTSLPNSYLIHLTRNKAKPIESFPQTANIRVDRNYCANNPTWEGIDTHAGVNLAVTNNVVVNTFQPIAIVACPDSADAGAPNIYAPRNVLVQGNTCISTVSDGSRRPGIIVQGAAGAAGPAGSYSELASGCRVIGNTVIGHGQQSSTTSGGIQLYYTQGCVVQGNIITECSPAGVNLWHDNYGASIVGNIITDAWTTTGSVACPIYVSDEYNTSTIQGNTVLRGSFTATHVNDRAIFVSKSTATVKQSIGPNDMRGATLPVVDNSASSESSLIGNNIVIGAGNNTAFKLGFYGSAGTSRQDVTASTATVANLVDVLANLGLIRKL